MGASLIDGAEDASRWRGRVSEGTGGGEKRQRAAGQDNDAPDANYNAAQGRRWGRLWLRLRQRQQPYTGNGDFSGCACDDNSDRTRSTQDTGADSVVVNVVREPSRGGRQSLWRPLLEASGENTA